MCPSLHCVIIDIDQCLQSNFDKRIAVLRNEICNRHSFIDVDDTPFVGRFVVVVVVVVSGFCPLRATAGGSTNERTFVDKHQVCLLSSVLGTQTDQWENALACFRLPSEKEKNLWPDTLF